MPRATLVAIEEYLSTSYRPDCDYVDGELLERNLGQLDHGRLQAALGAWFLLRGEQWNIWVSSEQRIRVSSSRVRIADVCVISRDQPEEQVPIHPPLICIEVLSPDDSLRSLQPRIDDYVGFGVPNIWLIDPASRRAYNCGEGNVTEAENGILQVSNSPISLSIDGVFALFNK